MEFDPSSKLPPAAPEAERSVLGCLLLDPESIVKVADWLTAADFYQEHHRAIYEAVQELFRADAPVDLVTVATHLQAQDRLDVIGGPEYLADVQNEVPVATHITRYAEIVKHHATLRGLIKAGQTITGLGYVADRPLSDVLEEAGQCFFAATDGTGTIATTPLSALLDESYARYCEISTDPEAARNRRVRTGFASLDKLLGGGLNPSDLIYVAARPSIGKTAFGLQVALNAATRQQKRVGIISLEMSKAQLTERLIGGFTGVKIGEYRSGRLSEKEFERVTKRFDALRQAPIVIDAEMQNGIGQVRAKARRMSIEQGLDLLVVDYIQLMQGSRTESRVQEITEISRSLKLLAVQMNIPILAISQLSRSVESRGDKRPILSDLRDSGGLEQDADVVMMLYRDDYYHAESDTPNQLEVNIRKHRNGQTGLVRLFFDRDRMQFREIDDHQPGFNQA